MAGPVLYRISSKRNIHNHLKRFLPFLACGLLTGCGLSTPSIKSPPPPELSDYAPEKKGEWLNVADIFSYKENPSVVLKKYKEWIGRQYFNIIAQKNRATFALPANTVLNGYAQKDGRNPSILYSCSRKEYNLVQGTAISSISGETDNPSYYVYRVDGGTQWATKAWQNPDGRWDIEGVDSLSAEIKGAPKGLPKTFPVQENISVFDPRSKDPMAKIMTAKTFEMTIIPRKKEDDFPTGVYARWDFSTTLKDLKESGNLDRACQMMLGSDYISIPPTKAKAPAPDKKKAADKQEDKQ